MAAAAFVAFVGNSFFSTLAMSTVMNNFPHDRGRVAGLLTGYVSLSSSIVTTLFLAFFSGDIPGFLLFLTVGVNGVVLVAAAFVRLVPPEEAGRLSLGALHRVYIGYVTVSALAGYVVVAGVAMTADGDRSLGIALGCAVVPLACGAALLLIDTHRLHLNVCGLEPRLIGFFAPVSPLLDKLLAEGTRVLHLAHLPHASESPATVGRHRTRTLTAAALELEVAAAGTPAAAAASEQAAAAARGELSGDKSVTWQARAAAGGPCARLRSARSDASRVRLL